MTIIIALIGRKGGITKTTLTANIAAGLARQGKRVVAIETDGQGSLSMRLDVQPHDGFYNLIREDYEFSDVMVAPPQTFAGEQEFSGQLYLISASDRQMQIESDPETTPRIYDRFKELRGHVDYVVIDTSPAINEVNNAWFYVADWLVLPTLCEADSINTIRSKTLVYIEQAQRAAKEYGYPVAKVLGIVPNRFDTRIDAQKTSLGLLQGRHGDQYPIFPLIRSLSPWQTSSMLRASIYTYADSEMLEPYQRRRQQDAARPAQAELKPLLNRLLQVSEEKQAVIA